MGARAIRMCAACMVAVVAIAASASASVVYVGDSLGVGTTPYLEEQLQGTDVDVDVKTGRPSSTGVGVLSSLISPQHDVVVFDLGTNDDPAAPGAFAADLQSALDLSGDRCLVVATLNRPPLNGVSVNGLNRVVASFARANPQVTVVDWHGAASADPSLLLDGVHSDADGYALRASLFADAISSCSSFGTSVPDTPDDLPPAASAGRNDVDSPPDQEGPERTRPDPGVQALADALARAVATGAEFGS